MFVLIALKIVKEKYGEDYDPDNDNGDDSDYDSEEDEEEDETGALLTKELDVQIMKTISMIRSKAPEVYDTQKTFFSGNFL